MKKNIQKITIILFTLLFVGGINKVLCQTNIPNGVELSKFVPTSPEAAALSKYGQTQVNLYTGTPSVNIPLYELKSRDIAVPVSLSYSSSGTKVEELPSRVGLGWTLNAGGAITRSVRSRPDDKPWGYMDGNHKTDSINNANLNTAAGFILAQQAGANDFDVEPDNFYFNVGGISGKFFFDQNAQIHLIPEQKLKIEYQMSGSGTLQEITKFTITTLSGIKYTFGGLTNLGNKAYEDVNMPELFNNRNGYRVITAWYIVKIESIYGVVDFDYYNRNYETEYYTTVNKYQLFDLFIPSNTSCGYAGLWNSVDPPSKVPTDNSTRKYQYLNAVAVKTISCDNGKIEFSESGTQRTDQLGLYALNAVTVYNNKNSTIKNFVFTYNYNNNRLSLEKLIEGFPGALNPDGSPVNNKEHLFSYFENASSPIPSDRNSFSRDHWGYYNGKVNATLVPPLIHSFPTELPRVTNLYHDVYLSGANRYPDADYARLGVLKTVQYPTGGTTDFEYELNTQSNHPHEYSLQETKSLYTNATAFTTQNINGISTHLYSQALIVYNALGNKIRIQVYATNLGAAVGQVWKKDNAGNYSQLIATINNNTSEILLASGDYQVRVSNVSGSPAYTIDFNWQNDTNIFYTGGLRVKRIINTDPFVPAKPEIKRYEYLAANNISSGYSQGLNEYSYDMEDYYTYVCQPSQLGTVEEPYAIQYVIRTSTSNNSMMLPEGSSVGYSNVSEFIGENGEGGKNEYYYTSVATNPDVQHLNFPFGNGENYDYLRGRLNKEKTYKKTNTSYALLQETNKTISVQSIYETPTSRIGFNPQVKRQPEVPHPLSFGIQRQSGKIITAKIYENENRVTEYDPNTGIQLENKVQTLSISATNDLPTHILTLNSKAGEEIHQYTTYTPDISLIMPSTGLTGTTGDALAINGINKLYNSGKMGNPAEVITIKKLSDGNLYVTDGTLYFYNPNVPELSAVYKLDIKIPISAQSFISCFIYNPGNGQSNQLRYDSRYKKKMAMNVYDTKGNVLMQKKANDITMMYIWDYDQYYPSAEVVFPKSQFTQQLPYGDIPTQNSNTTSAPQPAPFLPYCAHSSFETSSGGNWSNLDASSITDAQSVGITAVTGNSIYNFTTTNSLSFNNMQQSETYYISIWCKSFPPELVTDIPATYTPEVLVTRNGWTLYRFEVSGVVTATVKGKGYADELRLYPKYGRMSTYTYQPLVGVTSSCDENNNVTYYEYDLLGRLKIVKDKDFNIIKVLDYKYKQ